MADSYFHVQLTAILDVLLKTAAVDICALADSVFTSLQREIERCTSENEDLRRQLQCFIVEQSTMSDLETSLMKSRERSSRSAEDGIKKVHDCKQKPDTGTAKSGQRKQSSASAGVKVEVTEMYVTHCGENTMDSASSDEVPTPCSAVAKSSAKLSDLSPDLKTESKKTASTSHSSQLEWNDCSITDYEDERENFPEEVQQELDDLNAEYAAYTHSNGEEEHRRREKQQMHHDSSLPQAPDLQCTFIQIDGTVSASISQNPESQTRSTFACNICGKRLISEQGLRIHMKTHATFRPYTCSQCGKSFTRKATMNFHENIHRGVKPYVCNICPKSFADPSALRRHKAIHKVSG